MYRIIRNRRGVANIVATMIIFAMMIVSMGILYSQISPTVLGYNARTLSTNQEFILLSIENEMEDLASSPKDAQTRINVISNNAKYDVNNGYSLKVGVYDSANTIVGNNFTANMGLFMIDIDGTFQHEANDRYLSRIANEDSMIQNDSSSINTNFVSKVSYRYDNAHYEMYSRARVDIVRTATVPNDVYVVTITVVQIYFETYAGGGVIDFPIQDSEFTLRLRRMESIISPSVTATGIDGTFTIRHSFDGIAGPNYSFGAGSVGADVTVNFIVIPILFSI